MSESPYIDARVVADELLITLTKLRRMSRRGEYPDLLHVTRGQWRVLRTDHEAWKHGRTVSAEAARAELMHERAKEALEGA